MKTIVVCINFRPFTTQPPCAQRGSKELTDWLEEEIERQGLGARVDRSVCLGHSSRWTKYTPARGGLLA